jgi:ADP-ribose pyrophosphatase YjhB (NUDIX family)
MLVARLCHRDTSGEGDADVTMRSSGPVPRQAAVIPVRRTEDGVVQVCLIRRKTSSKWSIPKGYIERGENYAQAALAEADEEAGLDGCIKGDLIGTYEYEKDLLRLTVAVYVMEVTEERTSWREMRWRERRWYSIEEAAELLRRHHVWPLYDRIRPMLATMSPNLPLQAPSGIEPEEH